MASSISNPVNNLAGRIHKIKCKYGNNNKEYKNCITKYKDCGSCLKYTSVKDDLIVYKCLYCNRNYQKMFDEKLKSNLLIHTNFLTMILNLFCCYENAFTCTNTRLGNI